MRIFRLLLILVFVLSATSSYSQFDRRQEKRIRIAEDTARKKNDLFEMYQRIHYGLLLGVHQGKETNIEFGLHRTRQLVYGIYAVSVSYEYNIQKMSNALSVGWWAGAWLGGGLFVATNTNDFKKYSMTLRPMVGFEYFYVGLYYSYNINFFDNTPAPGLNTHALTLRIHLAFITKKGPGIDKW